MLPLFSQELPTSCIAACVRMVLTGLGHPVTEEDIRHRCGQLTLGMRLNQVANGLRDLPVAVAYELGWTFDDLVDALRAGTNPIVGIDLRPVEGLFAFHAVVLVGVTAEHVLVHDPRDLKGPRSIGVNTFEAAWRAADREAVIITPEPRSVRRRLIRIKEKTLNNRTE